MDKGFNYKNKIVEYIKKNLKKGYTKESLKWALINQGHSKLQVETAFHKAEQELAFQAPILKTKPKITYEIIDKSTNLQSIQSEKTKKTFWSKWFSND